MHTINRVGNIQPSDSIDTSAFNEPYTDATLHDTEQHIKAAADATNQRRQHLTENGVRIIDTRLSMRPIDEHLREPYMNEAYMIKIANSMPEHHRVEQFAALALREMGLDAKAIAPVIDGDVSNKKADIIITLPCSDSLRELGCADKRQDDHCFHQVAIEVKRAHGKNAALGLPLFENDEYATEGFDRYPKWLYCDSVSAWTDKKKWHSRRGVPLLGVISVCNIVELSDEEVSVLGLLWLPDNGSWTKADTYNSNKGTHYTAYKAKGTSNILPLRALADQLMSETQAG